MLRENGQLVVARGTADYSVGGGLDMSRRYVIIDLTLVAPDAARDDQQPED